MAIEIVERARLAVPLQIARRRIGVEMHGEQPPPDEIGLDRFAHPERDIGLAHGEIELAVGEDDVDLDVGIEFEEFTEPRRQPVRADADRRGDRAIRHAGARGCR